MRAAVGQIGRLDAGSDEPAAVLAQMQAVVDATRRRLAEIEQKAVDAGYPPAGLAAT
jgi:hypothetical protein